MIVLLAQTDGPVPPCGPPEEAGWLCELVESTTGNDSLARAADVLIARPVTMLLILVAAFVFHRLARRGIRRLVRRIQEGAPADVLGMPVPRAVAAATITRRNQRAEALGTLLSSISGAVIWFVAALMALGVLGLDLGPLLAGAGVVGIALGFGAQTLVRDFLSGIFMLAEDQYGVGDIIDVGEAMGTVEAVSLRTTRLRDLEGTVWHVPNGEIHRVGNFSQEWARALLDVPVAYGTDMSAAMAVIQKVADDMASDPAWSALILSRPEVWGVQSFDADSVAIRTVLSTAPLEQWRIARELRRRLKIAFDEAGIEIPFPQRTVWMRQDGKADSPSPLQG